MKDRVNKSRIKNCIYCYGEFLYHEKMQFCPLCGALCVEEFKKQLEQIAQPNDATQSTAYPLIATPSHNGVPVEGDSKATPAGVIDEVTEGVASDLESASVEEKIMILNELGKLCARVDETHPLLFDIDKSLNDLERG